MKIGIVGYGYVGQGMAITFDYVAQVFIHDPARGCNAKQLVLESDLVVVCVPTPRMASGKCDTSIVESVVEEFSAANLIVIKSTVEPGTTQRLIDRFGDHVHFSPEYMGEGRNYVPPHYPSPTDARSHPFCIVGGERPQAVLDYFRRVMATSARYVATNATTAELAKYMENAYLATKVAFCNEFARIAQDHAVNYNEVRELWLCDPRVDPSHTLVFPDQRGFSGKCLPKDLSAIRHASLIETPLLDAVAQYEVENKS